MSLSLLFEIFMNYYYRIEHHGNSLIISSWQLNCDHSLAFCYATHDLVESDSPVHRRTRPGGQRRVSSHTVTAHVDPGVRTLRPRQTRRPLRPAARTTKPDAGGGPL